MRQTGWRKGLALGGAGKYKEGIVAYTRAIELDPKFAEAYWAYCGRGVAYSNLGDYRQAIRDFDKAIELNSKDAVAYYNRGYSLRRT